MIQLQKLTTKVKKVKLKKKKGKKNQSQAVNTDNTMKIIIQTHNS